MGSTLGTMLTMTTYGTWLRGDTRGWVDAGRIMPPHPILEGSDRERMKHPMYLFDVNLLLDVGRAIGQSLLKRIPLRIYAMTVQAWHVHVVVSDTPVKLSEVVKCAKDAARWYLRPGRPIWGRGYDKRFCFDDASLCLRIEYVERHNTESGLPARPWGFITSPFRAE